MEGGTRVKTVLDKPLHQLTEDDISQLTREDCRRYLKDKGMRRPSWNKSQAIQQVISLKSLLEPSPPIKATLNNLTVYSTSSTSAKDLSSAEVEGSLSVSPFTPDGCPNHPQGTSTSILGTQDAYHIQPTPHRCNNGSSKQFDQMSSFYSGKVNVYNGVPVDKMVQQACPITHRAASPIQFHQDEPSCDSLPNLNAEYQLPISGVKHNKAASDSLAMQSMLSDAEGQTNRQVSLQRYLEKRKDRGKFKMKCKTGISSSALEMYLSDQMKAPAISRQDSGSNTSATSQLGENGAPHTFFEAMGKHPKNLGIFIDLNDKV